ncbi:RDD family protein [Streptomyces longispororuber]|uniref:RDD family protein n=1 Tax=Streptomyces longispororuber TaxID=68230 RepID=UPI00370324F4
MAYVAAGTDAAAAVLADRGARFGARLLDLLFWFVSYFAIGVPIMLWIDASGGSSAQVVLALWLVTSFILYFPLCISRFGATLGKRICGVWVARTVTGAPVASWRAMGREFFWVFSINVPVLSFLDPLWCCWDKPFQQCLHDKVAGTVVVTR